MGLTADLHGGAQQQGDTVAAHPSILNPKSPPAWKPHSRSPPTRRLHRCRPPVCVTPAAVTARPMSSTPAHGPDARRRHLGVLAPTLAGRRRHPPP